MTSPQQAYLSPDSAVLRRTMVDCQIRTFDVTDQLVLARFLAVPRELFLPAELNDIAYSDMALRIVTEDVQRQLLPPLVLARMLQEAVIKSTDKVLDIGSSTGYSSALLAGLAASVVSLENAASLKGSIEANLSVAGITGVQAVQGPLSEGYAAGAPYDVILVNGGVEDNLEILLAQLSEGGRIIAIENSGKSPASSKAMRFESVRGQLSSRYLFDASAPTLEGFRKVPEFVF